MKYKRNTNELPPGASVPREKERRWLRFPSLFILSILKANETNQKEIQILALKRIMFET